MGFGWDTLSDDIACLFRRCKNAPNGCGAARDLARAV
jgi:hypothetical protein